MGTGALPLGEEGGREERLGPLHLAGGLVGVIVDLAAPDRGAGGVVAERGCEIAGVLQGLAERIVQMQAVVVAKLGARHHLAHRRDLGRLEPHRLQVGEAPVGLAEARR